MSACCLLLPLLALLLALALAARQPCRPRPTPSLLPSPPANQGGGCRVWRPHTRGRQRGCTRATGGCTSSDSACSVGRAAACPPPPLLRRGCRSRAPAQPPRSAPRRYAYATLAGRVSSRPFLTTGEKASGGAAEGPWGGRMMGRLPGPAPACCSGPQARHAHSAPCPHHIMPCAQCAMPAPQHAMPAARHARTTTCHARSAPRSLPGPPTP